jgi:hypothetical protein
MRHVAIPIPEGFLATADVEEARRFLAAADFFETAFGAQEKDQASLHAQVISALLEEVHGWQDELFEPGV